ncbi:hypothetical protein CFOL_v3_21995 [Cephalotus follicularis]|uniref:RING-type domain-containing protein n=1 Tax=Cephalotus follicularis TaxID=3775 RepID=A0A1Q3CE70_CEPFO|nr:hypothetical protein CFOL_v3_21995 [Cephalotus follicularis]
MKQQQSECGLCCREDRWLLHSLRHRGSYRKLCTNCVLNNHQGLFCPICLQVFDDDPPPPHLRLMCLRCPSISHLSCVSSSSAANFTCPPCSNPHFSFFSVNHGRSNDKDTRFIDKDSANALVAAAKIAAASMTKAATLARVEAERRVKEAAFAKKRAREALERLLYLGAKEKEKDSKFKPSVAVTEQKVKSRRTGSNRVHKNGVTSEGDD